MTTWQNVCISYISCDYFHNLQLRSIIWLFQIIFNPKFGWEIGFFFTFWVPLKLEILEASLESQKGGVTIFVLKNFWQWEILKNLWQWEILMIVWQCMSPFARKYTNPLWVRVQKEIHDFMGMGNLSWFYRCFPGVFELSQLSHKSHGIQYFVFRLSPQQRCSTYHLLFTLQRDLFRHS